ncbi:hexokinase-domain-containing protein [Pilobolus umbonatus]|nr:hexokinase-domain-containing protein [Pilobolus umbonatus]
MTDLSREQSAAVQSIVNAFDVSTDKLKTICDKFVQEMEKGLDHEGATVAMIPSYVSGRCTGEEKGTFLALDLGGTNLRVCQVNLLGHGKSTIQQQKYVLRSELKAGPIRDLCEFIAECVDSFLTEYGNDNSSGPIPLGYTFSFPILQTSVNRGVLKQWTKGFACQGAVGKDPAVLLQDAFRRKNLNVAISAIVNDTVGTLMAHAYQHPDTLMGVIMGTGFNGSYYQDMHQVNKWKGSADQEMVINMESGAFDCEREVLPLTVYDNKLDRLSINVGQQLYEKSVAGMYLGEITRNALIDMIDQRLLFNGRSSAEMNNTWSFETAYMSTIEVDNTPNLDDVGHILESILNIPNTTLADRKIVKTLCHAVGRRAARLGVVCIIGCMLHTKRVGTNCIIAIDGSLFEYYPDFDKNMSDALAEVLGEDARSKVSFDLTKDGSGLGAAIIAMQAAKA